ncbi:MAG: hypothetical protein V8T51_01115 [Senegalimassilia faecalis]
MDFNAWLVDVTGEIDGFMYTYILLILLVAVGVYFAVPTKGVQIRFIKDMFKQLTEKKHVAEKAGASSRRSRRWWSPPPAAWARATSPAWPRPLPRVIRAPCAGWD